MKKKKKLEAEKFILPTQRSQIAESLEDYSMLIYGQKKIGKTTLLAEFLEAFFLMFEVVIWK